MRIFAFLVSTAIALVGVTCSSVARHNDFLTYCGKHQAPADAVFLCFQSYDGPVRYDHRYLNGAVIYVNPETNKDWVLVFKEDYSWATVYTKHHEVEFLVAGTFKERCVHGSIRPKSQADGWTMQKYCLPQDIIEIPKSTKSQ